MNQLDDLAAFQVVTISIGQYQSLPQLDQVAADANRIIEVLHEFGGQASDYPVTSKALDETEVKHQLRLWASRTTPRSGVVLWLGHGASNGADAWLASSETPYPIDYNGIVPQTLADQIDIDWLRRDSDDDLASWTLVIIEACGAGTFVRNLGSLLLKNGVRRVALVGVGGDGAAYLGRLAQALSSTAASYTDNDERVRLNDFVSRLTEFLPLDEVVPLSIRNQSLLPRRRLIDTQISAPVDVYRELVTFLTSLSPDERSHFIPKAQGAELGELAWYFVGREAERREISAWLRESTSGMLIVTGRAGSGKSALLGNVLVHANSGLRDLLVQGGQLEREAPIDLPPDDVFDAVVHLTGMTTRELVRRIALAANIRLPVAESAESGQDLEVVLASLRDRPFTILTDALDEAQEPAAIASSVLQRLAALPRTRVIVGTRMSTREGPDQPLTADRDLLDSLDRGHPKIISLERDPAAIAAYVRHRLTVALGGQADQVAVELIIALSTGREREFLFARLAVHEIIARPSLLSPDSREELETLLAGDHRALFAAAVARLTAGSPMAHRLLEALGLARGRGIPRADRIWAIVAGAIAGGDALHESDIDRILAEAAPFIMLDAEGDQSVYRLAHQTFREHFLSLATTRPSARHKSVVRALIASAAGAGELNPYIVHRLAEHVAEADSWQELADAPAVLDKLDPESVAAEALRTGYGRADLPLAIAASLSARHLLSSAGVVDRWMTRQIAMACIESSADTSGGIPAASWALLSRHDPLHVLLIGHAACIRSVTTLHLADGRVLLATGADDGTIRLWDPNTGRPVGDPMEGAGSPRFQTAAFRSSDGRTLLAVGGGDGRLRLWDPGNGQFYSDSLAGHTGPVLGVICLSGRYEQDTIVTCGFDSRLLAWEMTAGRPVTHRPLLTDYRSRVMSALTPPDGRTGLVTGGYDNSVRLWDLATTEPSARRLTGHVAAIRAIATLTLPDGRYLVASGGDDEVIRVWDSYGDSPSGRLLAGHSGAVHAIATLTLPGDRAMLASGGEDAAVRLWDPLTGQSVGEPLTGHKQPIRTLTTVVLRDGRTLLASGSDDKTVRIWDPSLARRISRRSARRTPRLTALAAAPMSNGAVMLMTGDDEGVIQLRDPRTGTAVGQPMAADTVVIRAATAASLLDGQTVVAASGGGGSIVRWALGPQSPIRLDPSSYGHTGTVRAMTSLPLPGGRMGLASAGTDDKIRLWDLLTGNSEGFLAGGHRGTVRALATVTVTGRPAMLASAGDDSAVILWDLGTLRPRARLTAPGVASFAAVAVVPGPANEMWLAGGASDGSICIWDVSSSRLSDRLAGAGDAVLSLAAVLLPDGRQLVASGTADGSIRLWDMAHGIPLRTIALPLDQRAHNLIAMGTAIAIQTDIGVIMSEFDPVLVSLPSSRIGRRRDES